MKVVNTRAKVLWVVHCVILQANTTCLILLFLHWRYISTTTTITSVTATVASATAMACSACATRPVVLVRRDALMTKRDRGAIILIARSSLFLAIIGGARHLLHFTTMQLTRSISWCGTRAIRVVPVCWLVLRVALPTGRQHTTTIATAHSTTIATTCPLRRRYGAGYPYWGTNHDTSSGIMIIIMIISRCSSSSGSNVVMVVVVLFCHYV